MQYSQKYVLDDVALVTHQKFPSMLTRRNFKSAAAFQSYFTLLNDALIARQNGVNVKHFQGFPQLCELLQKEIKTLDIDPAIFNVENYADDYLQKYYQFQQKFFQIDNTDMIEITPDIEKADVVIKNDNMKLDGTDIARINQYDYQLKKNMTTGGDIMVKNEFTQKDSHWWKEQDFQL